MLSIPRSAATPLNNISFERSYLTLAVAGIGVILSVGAWFLVSTWDHRQAEQEFSAEAEVEKFVLENGLAQDLRELSALRALFESSERGVSRHEFLAFAGKVFANDGAVLSTTWIPRVKREDRAAHEAEGAREGIPNYRIKAVAPDNSLVTAAESEEYFPLFYLTEDPSTSIAFGLDLGSEPKRRATVEFARDHDQISLSANLVLHSGTGDRKGFFALLPVYRPNSPHSSVEERRENLIGLVQGVFQTSVAVEEISLKTRSQTGGGRVFVRARSGARWPASPRSSLGTSIRLHCSNITSGARSRTALVSRFTLG